LKTPKVKIKDENFFFKLVKAAFAQRRKMVLNSVSSSLNLGKDLVLKALEQARIDPKRRAEALSLEELAFFSNVLNKL
jgi:16S rRNA (adenine1518-N6/adenine1519-N6)-dimethyltransferase